MGAVELLHSEAPFVADTSAWWRFASLPGDLAQLIKTAVVDERLWITPIVRMEIRDTHFDKLAGVLAFENVELPGS